MTNFLKSYCRIRFTTKRHQNRFICDRFGFTKRFVTSPRNRIHNLSQNCWLMKFFSFKIDSVEWNSLTSVKIFVKQQKSVSVLVKGSNRIYLCYDYFFRPIDIRHRSNEKFITTMLNLVYMLLTMLTIQLVYYSLFWPWHYSSKISDCMTWEGMILEVNLATTNGKSYLKLSFILPRTTSIFHRKITLRFFSAWSFPHIK